IETARPARTAGRGRSAGGGAVLRHASESVAAICASAGDDASKRKKTTEALKHGGALEARAHSARKTEIAGSFFEDQSTSSYHGHLAPCIVLCEWQYCNSSTARPPARGARDTTMAFAG